MRSGILLKMKLASLPRNRRKYAHSGSFQTNMIVADDQLQTMKSPQSATPGTYANAPPLPKAPLSRSATAYPFFKAGRIKTAISRLRDGQLNLALKRIDGTRFEPVGVVSSQVRTLIGTCVETVLTFHFHCFIEKHLHDFTQTVKTFFRNDLQNRLRHAKFFHCDKSSRFVLFSGKVNKAVRRTYHIFLPIQEPPRSGTLCDFTENSLHRQRFFLLASGFCIIEYGNICGGSLLKLEILRQSLSPAASVMSVKSD